jgi:hypothetical protein
MGEEDGVYDGAEARAKALRQEELETRARRRDYGGGMTTAVR